MSVRTIFLSHSSKDIHKVRKIRDILESMEFEPLLFHMKCLDDNNEELEEFIKKEIDARNVFVYCKSKNAEESLWVQTEVAYILHSPNKRIYEIDIEKPLRETLVSFLHSLAELIRHNSIFIACSHADKDLCNAMCGILEENGYEVIRYTTFSHETYIQHDEDLDRISQNGIFLPIITPNFINSVYCISEIEKVLYNVDDHNILFKPIFVNISQSIAARMLPTAAQRYAGYSINASSFSDPEKVQSLLEFLVDDNRIY